MSWKAFLLSTLLLLSVASSAVAATFIVPPDRDFIRRADAIVIATAQDSVSRPTAGGSIETVTRLLIDDVLKGDVSGLIEVTEPGGALGDRAVIIPGIPRFAAGERSLVFLTRTPAGTWAVTEIALGKFVFAHDRNGHDLLLRAEDDVAGWNPDGTPYVDPHRDAAKFLSFIRAEAHGAVAPADYAVPYAPLRRERQIAVTSTPTKMAVTAFSATSYTSDLGDGRGGRWTVFPNPVGFFTNTGASSTAVASVNTAFASWNNDCASVINYVNSGPDTCNCHTSGLAAGDGANTVLFERNLSGYGIGAFSCSGTSYSGTLGIGGITVASGTHIGPNGETFYTTQEGDVEMNQGVLGCSAFISKGDLPSAVAHEAGHSLGFRHSDQTRANSPSAACSTDPSLECSSNAIMRSFVPTGIAAALQAYDQHAAAAVYPGGSCGSTTPPPPTSGTTTIIKDFNGDNQSDLLWRNTSTGENVVWFLSSGHLAGSATLPTVASQSWRLNAAADFSGDRKLDLVWRNYSTGANTVWLMNNTALSRAVDLPTADLNWFIEASGDFNGDGNTDLVFRNAANGRNVFWRMIGTTLASGVEFDSEPNTAWQIIACADYNNDGVADLYFHNTSTGGSAIWFIRNFAFAGGAAAEALTDLRWQGAGPR